MYQNGHDVLTMMFDDNVAWLGEMIMLMMNVHTPIGKGAIDCSATAERERELGCVFPWMDLTGN